jgi:hypothetical protein
MVVGGQRQAPDALPSVMVWYQSYTRLGGPQSRLGRVREVSPPKGLDPRTFYSVARSYINYAIPTHNLTGLSI